MDIKTNIEKLLQEQKRIISDHKEHIDCLEQKISSRFNDGLYLFVGEEGFDVIIDGKEQHCRRPRKNTGQEKMRHLEEGHRDNPYPEIRFNNVQL